MKEADVMEKTIQDSVKLIRQFHIKSIFFKYLRNFFLILMLPFLILNMVVFFSYKNIMTDKTSDMLSQSAALTYSSVSQQIDNADNSFLTLISDKNIENFFSYSTEDFSPTNVLESLSLHLTNTKGLEAITLYNFSNPYVFSTKGGGELDKFKNSSWYNYYIQNNMTTFAITSEAYSYVNHSDEKFLTFCYGFYENSRCNGLIILDYNFDTIDEKISPTDNSFYLVDSYENIVYSTDKAMRGGKLPADIPRIEPSTNITKNLGNTIVSSHKFSSRPLTLIGVTNQDDSYLHIFLLVSLLISLFLSAAIASYISISSYKTLTEIINSLYLFDTTGNIKEHPNEISFIIQNLMNVMNKSKNAENELAEKMVLLKNTQLAAMQLQFNQHFLFNTLNLISMSARTEAGGKKNTTSSAISLLADLLRISLNTEQYIVNVYAELMYAQKYIEIEQMKLKNMFTVNYDIDEDLYECKIVKLIFQPLIENAFRHGLQPLPREKEKILTISGRTRDNDIVFHITDNGVGIQKEKLSILNRKLHSNLMPESNHIGLSNVNARLKLIFGEEYGLSINSDENGTDVEIRIPKL